MSTSKIVLGKTPTGDYLPLNVDSSGNLQVSGGGGGGGGSSVDRELITTTYKVITAFTGASVGDIITSTQIVDVSDVPTTVSTVWRNQTTAADLASAPSAANLELASKTPALVDGKLPVDASGSNVYPSNITAKFRETFEVWPSPNFTQTKASCDIVTVDGNALGASYLVISKCPFTPGAETFIDTNLTFSMPVEVAAGLHLSQNAWGQDHSIEFLDTEFLSPAADLEIASITQATTTLTVVTTLPHNLAVGKRIGIRDCSDSRVNYPSVVVASILSATSFTVTGGPNAAIPSLTVTDPVGAKGFVYFRPALSASRNGSSLHFESPTATLGFFYTRASAGDALPFASGSGNTLTARQAVAVGSTASVPQIASAPFTYSFVPTVEYKLVCQADRLNWVDQTIDGVATATNRVTRTQVIPNDSKLYKVRIKSINEPSLTVPVGEIVSVSKAGSTTATVVTAAPHGLVTGDTVVGYGVRDVGTGFFPALATAAAVTVVDATTFTVVWGTSSSNTSRGGFIAKIQGGAPLPGIVAPSIQSIAKSTQANGDHILTVVGSTTWAGFVIGDYVNLYGVRDAATGELLPQNPTGAWRVANIATSTLTLVNIAGVSPSLEDFAAVNCGGGILKRTDLRISYLRIFDYLRQRVEILPRPAADAANAVNVGGAVTVSGSLTTLTTLTTLTGGGAAEDAAAGSSPVMVGGVVRTAVSPITLIAGDAARATMTTGAASVVYNYAVPEVQATANLSLSTTTEQTIRAAGAAGVRNYLVGLQVYNSAATAVDVIILDGATEIWRQTVNATSGREFNFALPLRGTAATALNVNLSAAASSVRVNAQTFQSA